MANDQQSAPTMAQKPESIIAMAHSDLTKAHAHLQDELYGLSDKLQDILTPTAPNDATETSADSLVTSTMASLLQQETLNVHRAIDYIQQLKNRIEL